jgi:hypothetical protein
MEIYNSQSIDYPSSTFSFINQSLKSKPFTIFPKKLEEVILYELKLKTCWPLFKLIYNLSQNAKEKIKISQKYLSTVTHQSISSIKRQLKKLIKNGLIKINRTLLSNKRFDINEYEISIPKNIEIAVTDCQNRHTTVDFDYSTDLISYDDNGELINNNEVLCDINHKTCETSPELTFELEYSIYNNIINKERFCAQFEQESSITSEEKPMSHYQTQSDFENYENSFMIPQKINLNEIKEISEELERHFNDQFSKKKKLNSKNLTEEIIQSTEKLKKIEERINFLSNDLIEVKQKFKETEGLGIENFNWLRKMTEIEGKIDSLNIDKANIDNYLCNKNPKLENNQTIDKELIFNLIKRLSYTDLKRECYLEIGLEILFAVSNRYLKSKEHPDNLLEAIKIGVACVNKKSWKRPHQMD